MRVNYQYYEYEHLDHLMKILIDVAYKYVPCKKSARSGSHTKIPRHRRILMRKRRKLFDQLKQAKSEVNQENIKDRLIKIELLLQKSHAESRSRREQLAVKAIKTNSKYFSHTQNSFPVLSRPSDEHSEYTGCFKTLPPHPGPKWLNPGLNRCFSGEVDII